MTKDTKPAKPKKPALVDIPLGPLPVDMINRTLGLDLEPGEVVFTAAAQRHAIKRHADDYAKCVPHLGQAISSPSFVGDDFKNPSSFELVVRVAALGGVLVAVGVERDASGHYRVYSAYPVSGTTIENRRQKNHLKPPLWK